MHTPCFKYIIVLVLALGIAVVVWGVFAGKPPVSLTILSLTSNHLDHETAALLGSRTDVTALIAARNNTKRSFTYWAQDPGNSLPYDILRATPQGWKALRMSWCGLGLTEHTWLPSQCITFEAQLGCKGRFKIGFNYLDGKPPNPMWQRLPSWVTQRMAWLKPWRTATTDVIDLKEPGI